MPSTTWRKGSTRRECQGGFTFGRSSLVQGTCTAVCFRLNLKAAENNASISEEGKVVRQQAKNSYRRSAGAVSNVSLNGLQDALPFHQHQEYHWPQRRPALIEKKKEREWEKKHKDAVKNNDATHVSSFKTETICHNILTISKKLQPAWSQRKALKWIQNGREQCCAIFHSYWPLSSLIVLSYGRYTASCGVTVCQSKRTFKPGVPGRPAPPSLPGAPWNRRTLFHTWLSLRPLAMMSKPTGFPGYPCGPSGPALPFAPCKCHYHYRQLSSSEICYIFFHVRFWGPGCYFREGSRLPYRWTSFSW